MKESGYFPGTDQAAEGSAVFIDNKTGGVRAAVGGRDYVTKDTTGLRRSGSRAQRLSRLPYTGAMQEDKFKPYSLLQDKLTSYDGYEPKNYDGQYKGK